MKYKKITISLLIFALSFLILPSVGHADFIDDAITKYESETDSSEDRSDMLRDALEGIGLDGYDSGSNTIDCSWYDVQCHLQGNFIFSNMVGMVKFGLTVIQNIISGAFINVQTVETINLKEGFSTLATTMCAIFILWHAMRITILYVGEPDDGMSIAQEKLWAIVAIGILLGVYTQFYEWILNLITITGEELLNQEINVYDTTLALAVNGAFYGFIIALILAVVIVVFAVSLLYRYTLFTLLYIVGVLAIPTMLNDEYNLFKVWLRILVSNFITLFLQILCFTLGFNKIASISLIDMATGLMFFILALTVPSLLNQFGASSGSAKAMASGTRTVVRAIARR